MDKLIHWALHNRPLVLAVAALLTALGIHTALTMPVDVFPDLTSPTVIVITDANGMSPTETETQITFPVETAVNGATGVRRVRSATAVGISVVWVEFEWGTDIREARQIVNEKLAAVAGDLPPEAGRPTLAPQSSIMGEILFLALSSDRHDMAELRSYAETSLRRRLLAVPGVSQVTPIGGEEKQFHVVLDPTALQARRVTLDQVVRALGESNENISAGIIAERGSEWLVTGVGRVRRLSDIAATVVAAPGGVPILVGDLGRVEVGHALKRGEGSAMGEPAVLLGIQKQPAANTLELTRLLDQELGDVQAALPEGMVLRTDIFRQADFIEVSIRNVRTALVEGIIMVILVVLLFLGNVRATAITLTAIPLSLVTTVLALKWMGVSINTMSLGGMAIAIGALVDDAVIDVENVFRRLRANHALPPERRRPLLRVVFDASVEIRSSIVFATLIIGLVFVPIFFLSGVEGRLLPPLGLAYLVALAASLVVAVTVTPVLCSFLLPASLERKASHEPAFVRWLKGRYEPILRQALDHPWRFAGPALGLLAIALASTTQMGRSFLPEFNEGSLTISAVTMPGTTLEESDKLGLAVEKTLLEFPEVVAVGRRTGRAELDEHVLGVETTELEVSIALKERGKEEFLDALREAFARVPGVTIIIGQPISHRIDHMLSGTRANIAVKIFGPDLHRLRDLAERTRQAMEDVEGVVDLSVEQQMEIPILTVRFQREEIARHGLTIRQVAATVGAALQGIPVSRILEGQNSYDLVVRLEGGGPWRVDTLGDLLVDTPGGARVPLRSLARIQRDSGPNLILREQIERKIVVQCNVAGRDLAGVARDVRRQVDPVILAEPGYRVELAGQFESAAEAGRRLTLISIAVVVGIGFLLHVAFRSARDTILVMSNLPLALIGGVAGVFAGGGVLSVASLIGFITVFGIATRNGIMLVSHIRHLQAHEGVSDFREAVRRGALERLVPILMTALAAGMALVPLALGGDKPGNEIQTPMAIVILFGLMTSMLLNMVIVPALYLKYGRPASIGTGGDE